LFYDPELVEQIARDTHDRYSNESEPVDPDASSNPHHVAARKAWRKKDRSAFAQDAEQQVRQQLAFAADKAAEVLASSRLKAMRKFRDAYIAHNLALPEPDMKTEEKVAPLRYGEERALLEDTVAVADALHCGLNGTSFDWEGSKQIARGNAAALWDNCAFDVPSRSSQR
jgi:hypothetical protein